MQNIWKSHKIAKQLFKWVEEKIQARGKKRKRNSSKRFTIKRKRKRIYQKMNSEKKMMLRKQQKQKGESKRKKKEKKYGIGPAFAPFILPTRPQNLGRHHHLHLHVGPRHHRHFRRYRHRYYRHLRIRRRYHRHRRTVGQTQVVLRHLIMHFPTSSGVSGASERANGRADAISPDSWLFCPTV